jgi:nucleotide-binding universal stress UspA family protein
MTVDERPVVVAFDGSDEARGAVTTAAALFRGRRLLVVSVWEPGLAMAMAPVRDVTGVGYAPPSGEEIVAIDRAQRDHAAATAAAGVDLARRSGADAQPHPIADEADIADTLAAVADRVDAAALVVGSRGLGGMRARLLGSTSRSLLQKTERPVLVVKGPH